MPHLLRNVLAIFGGTLAAIVLIALVQAVAHALYPPPPDFDFNNPEAMAELMANAPVGALLLVILSYLLGTLAGSAVAAKLSAPEGPARQGFFVGVLMLIAAAMNLLKIPHPLWFAIGSVVAIIVAGFFGTRLGCKLRKAS